METATDIFEVLTAIARLFVIVFAGVVMVYCIVVLHLVHELLKKIRAWFEVSKRTGKETETGSDNRNGLLAITGYISGMLLSKLRKRRK